MKQDNTAVVLLNIGSPKKPDVFHVACYLSQFLGNKHIISLPWLIRMLLVNGIIVPGRSFKSSKRYKKLWKKYDGNFPLNLYGNSVAKKLQDMSKDNITVYIGMRYGENSIKNAVKKINESHYSKIILLPLFPQYAKSSTDVVVDEALSQLQKVKNTSEIISIKSFYDHPMFIAAWAERILQHDINMYDLILFSYHSLPAKEAIRMEKDGSSYEKSCARTTQLIQAKAKIDSHKVVQVYHSQMSSDWFGPFLDNTLIQKAKEGIKRILLVMPGFVADCLETVQETEEYKELFFSKGGEILDLVESLNDNSMWIQALQEILKK